MISRPLKQRKLQMCRFCFSTYLRKRKRLTQEHSNKIVVLNKVIFLDDPVGSLKRLSYCITLSVPSIIIYAFITQVFSVLHNISVISDLVFDVNICSRLHQQFDTLVEAVPGHLVEGCVAIL